MTSEQEEELKTLRRQVDLLASVYRLILELAEANTRLLQAIAINQKENAECLLGLSTSLAEMSKQHAKMMKEVNQFLQQRRNMSGIGLA